MAPSSSSSFPIGQLHHLKDSSNGRRKEEEEEKKKKKKTNVLN